MGQTGLIDWHRLCRTDPWRPCSGDGETFVYAFWMADSHRDAGDAGVSILKDEGGHPDWFVHADTAATVLNTVLLPDVLIGPGMHAVLDAGFRSRPMLGSLLIGTADFTLRSLDGEQYWHATESCVTRPGWRILQKVNSLYLRKAHLLTFIHQPSDES